MIIPEVSAQTPVYDRRSYSAAVTVSFSNELTLKTQEGDLVNLSFEDQQSLAESETSAQYADGEFVSEFSSVAVAASRYSLTVQGDLNEDELNAIQKLVQEISPIAQRFFAQGEFDAEGAIQSLSGSLGVIEDVELALERVITATFSAQSVSSGPSADLVNPESAVGSVSGEEPVGLENIRNLPELVFASLEAEFESQAGKFPDGTSILRSLSDLMLFLREQLGSFLNPLENVSPEQKPVPQDITIGTSSAGEENVSD